jgi:hypothetical protein
LAVSDYLSFEPIPTLEQFVLLLFLGFKYFEDSGNEGPSDIEISVEDIENIVKHVSGCTFRSFEATNGRDDGELGGLGKIAQKLI